MNTDSTGLVLDTIPDIALAGYSIYSAYNEPTWLNIGSAGLCCTNLALQAYLAI